MKKIIVRSNDLKTEYVYDKESHRMYKDMNMGLICIEDADEKTIGVFGINSFHLITAETND